MLCRGTQRRAQRRREGVTCPGPISISLALYPHKVNKFVLTVLIPNFTWLQI
jgi:hypothetical protein